MEEESDHREGTSFYPSELNLDMNILFKEKLKKALDTIFKSEREGRKV